MEGIKYSRPNVPSPAWLKYESEHFGKTQAELKAKHPRDHSDLLKADQLIFVPTDPKELEGVTPWIKEKHSAVTNGKDKMQLTNVIDLLVKTSVQAGLGLSADTLRGTVVSIAQTMRANPAEAASFESIKTPKGNSERFLYSQAFVRRLAYAAVKSKKNLDAEDRVLWREALDAYFEGEGK